MDVSRHGLRRARALRQAMTPPEARLWSALKAGRLLGLKFRRQHPFGPYTLDFYCEAARLAVEVDGWSHNFPERVAHDARRDAWLESCGVRTLRLPAAAIRDMDATLATILAEARRAFPPPVGEVARRAGEGFGARPQEA